MQGKRGFYGLELGVVTFTGIDESGFHAIQFDAFGEKSSGMAPVELSHTYGFASRALPPDPSGKGCSVFYWLKGSSEGFAWLANDPRVQSLLPEIQDGETYHYGPKGQFIRCHADGRISIFTTDDATPNGKSVYFQVAPNGFSWVAPWGRITFDLNGFHLLHVSGARIDLGAIGGLPAPLDHLSSYVTMSAQIARVEGAIVGQGAPSVSAQPAAKATTAYGLFTALSGVITALEAPGAIIAPSGGGPCTVGPALGAAIEAAKGAIAAASVTLASSTMVS